MLDNYKKILVGIDGSVEATKAFDKAVATALRNDAELVIANVIDLRAFNLSQPMIQLLLMIHTKVLKTSLMTLLTKQKKLALKKSKTRVEFGSPKVMLGQTLPKKKKLASLFLELLVFLTLNVSLSVQWRITLSKMHHAVSRRSSIK